MPLVLQKFSKTAGSSNHSVVAGKIKEEKSRSSNKNSSTGNFSCSGKFTHSQKVRQAQEKCAAMNTVSQSQQRQQTVTKPVQSLL